jgi:hypothetical protein
VKLNSEFDLAALNAKSDSSRKDEDEVSSLRSRIAYYSLLKLPLSTSFFPDTSSTDFFMCSGSHGLCFGTQSLTLSMHNPESLFSTH